MQYFGIALAKSAPHVYISALPFAPKNSLVYAKYSSLFPHTLLVEHGQLSDWPSSEMVISNVGSKVCSIAVSPDGQQIVSGSYDKTVCVWNAMTGEMVAGPFTGHIGPVNSVVFSPVGQCIISGSSDQTIHMWSLNSSRRNTMAGHTCSVKPVEFPSDGKHIVSSEDKSIDTLNSVTERLITTTQVNFTDQSVIDDDGWICGNKGELLMWIPHLHRPSLQHPSNIWIVGNHKTHLDLSNFVHGHSWMRCIKS